MTAAVRDVLTAAADAVQVDGWVQHEYVGDTGAHCLVGAVVHALGGDGGESTVPVKHDVLFSQTLAAVAAQVPEGWSHSRDLVFSLTRWNDNVRRTATEVIDVLRAAAAAAEVTRP